MLRAIDPSKLSKQYQLSFRKSRPNEYILHSIISSPQGIIGEFPVVGSLAAMTTAVK